MRISIVPVICLGLWALSPTAAAQEETSAPSATPETATPAAPKSLGHKLLFYVPNRVFDVFDFARVRLRIGPGIGIGARATSALEVGAGAYATVWGGVRGPRGKPEIPWPIGAEARAGAKVGKGADTGGPYYGASEVGFGFHLAIFGFVFGVDPLEVVDLAGGFLMWDPIGDDF
jgi:hypothetical protein